MDFIAIDFETANQNPTSACSIGIVGVANGKIEFEEYHLINPHELFNEYNIAIHHITPDDIENSDSFEILWSRIKGYFDNVFIFAHNALFDLSVLKANIEKYHLEVPSIRFGCTCKMAGKLWKEELSNFRLNTVSDFLGFELNHHNALSDARACAQIVIRGMRVMGASTVSELYDALGLRFGYYDAKRFFSSFNKYQRNKNLKIIENANLNEKVILISGKPCTMTRAELTLRLLENGAYVEKGINRSLDYFLELGNCPQLKRNIVTDLIAKGYPIKIITEKEILEILK